MGNFSVPRYGVVMHLPIKPKGGSSKKYETNMAPPRRRKKKKNKNKAKIKQNTVPQEDLSPWFKNPCFLIDETVYEFKDIVFKRAKDMSYTLELTCEGIVWKLQKDTKDNISIQPYEEDCPIAITAGTLTAKMYRSFLKLTYKVPFKDFLSVGIKFFPIEPEGKKLSSKNMKVPETTLSEQEAPEAPSPQKKATKKELLLWLERPSLGKGYFTWLDNPSLRKELLGWFGNPFLIIDKKKYVFKDIVIRQLDENYVLVMTCCDVKWAFRKNKKGTVSVFVFYKGKPVEVKKKSIVSKINVFFSLLTKNLTFENFLADVSKRFPCEPATRFNLYLFDPNTVSQTVISI